MSCLEFFSTKSLKSKVIAPVYNSLCVRCKLCGWLHVYDNRAADHKVWWSVTINNTFDPGAKKERILIMVNKHSVYNSLAQVKLFSIQRWKWSCFSDLYLFTYMPTNVLVKATHAINYDDYSLLIDKNDQQVIGPGK